MSHAINKPAQMSSHVIIASKLFKQAKQYIHVYYAIMSALQRLQVHIVNLHAESM